MKRFALLASLTFVVAGPVLAQNIIYNNLFNPYVRKWPSWDGGQVLYFGGRGCLAAQRITIPAGTTQIVNVTAQFVQQIGPNPASVYVQVNQLFGFLPGPTIYANTVPAVVTTFSDTVFGLNGRVVQANALFVPVTPGQSYLISVQPQGTNWGEVVGNNALAVNPYVRDFSSFAYPGQYNNTFYFWQGPGNGGNLNMQVAGQ